MIIGIGCDIVIHEEAKTLNWFNNSGIQNRIFSRRELDLYRDEESERFLSGRFAAKEAILKCFGTGMVDSLALTDIEILQSNSGAPIVELTGQVKEKSIELGIDHWHISITHSLTQSIAFVVAESETTNNFKRPV